MSTGMAAPNRTGPQFLWLSLAGAGDVLCFVSCVWISERNPPASAAPEPSQKSVAHRLGDVLPSEVGYNIAPSQKILTI